MASSTAFQSPGIHHKMAYSYVYRQLGATGTCSLLRSSLFYHLALYGGPRTRHAGSIRSVHDLLLTRSQIAPPTALSGYQLPSSLSPPFAAGLPSSESPLLALSNKTLVSDGTFPLSLAKASPSFHLLIPASESNPNLCKTLLSSFLLNYPPPTLINYGKIFEGVNWDNGTHCGKIRGVYDYLRDSKWVRDDDLVLVIDGYDVWFQLPPEVMIERYHTTIRAANERLRRQYGMITPKELRTGDKTERAQKYAQSVVFAADKLCWPNPAEDPACAALPPSTLRKDVYGPETDKDPDGFLNRPRYLNSGTVIGPAAEVRAIYEYALKKVEEENRGIIGDQFVFAEIFGEQEYQRQLTRRTSQGAGGRWLDWLSNALGTSYHFNGTINNMTVVPGQRYEFGLGLDYESQLFQTMTHSASDVDFLSYNDTALLEYAHKTDPNSRGRHLSLPSDIHSATPPMGEHDGGKMSDLGTVPEDTTWQTLPLATNLHVPSIPTLLHLNGDKSLLETWWPRMWFQPYSRALLRHFMRTPAEAATAGAGSGAETGSPFLRDSRGGKGGVWTDGAVWLEWADMCRGVEQEVFADGMGVWGRGGGRVLNQWGTVVAGEE